MQRAKSKNPSDSSKKSVFGFRCSVGNPTLQTGSDFFVGVVRWLSHDLYLKCTAGLDSNICSCIIQPNSRN